MYIWDEGKRLSPPRVSHACGNISVMPEGSNQRTSERAQLLAAMTHPSRELNLNVKQSFVTPKSYIYIHGIFHTYTHIHLCMYICICIYKYICTYVFILRFEVVLALCVLTT